MILKKLSLTKTKISEFQETCELCDELEVLYEFFKNKEIDELEIDMAFNNVSLEIEFHTLFSNIIAPFPNKFILVTFSIKQRVCMI